MPEERDIRVSRKVPGGVIEDKTIEELQIRVGELEAEKFTLATEKEILSIDNEKLKTNIATLTEEKQQLSDRVAEIESELVRPTLTSTELVSSFKDAMDLMQEGLKTKEGRVGYIINKFDVDLKANIGVDQDNRVIIQSPHIAENVPAENLSVIHFSLKAVPKPDVIETEEFISVPNLIGRERNDAIKIIEDAGLTKGGVDERLSPTPSGIVIDQNPETDAMVPPKTAIDIVISKSKYVVVPNVIGLNKEDAIAVITNSDLNVGEVTEQVKGAVPDIVLSQSIPARAEVIRGSAVDLVIAEPEKVKVPNLIGKTKDDAIKTIDEVKLKVGEIKERESAEQNGTVIEQNPEAGSEVVIETAVNLVIAKPGKIKVPNLIGKPKWIAINTIKRARLKLGEIKERESREQKGTVIEQNPEAGSEVVIETAVNLVIAKAEKVKVPDLITKTKDDAIKAIEEARLKVGKITEKESAEPEGTVIGQDTKKGTGVVVNTNVDFTIAKLMEVTEVIMPNVTGVDLNKAKEIITKAGLKIGRITRRISRKSPGKVIIQNPKPDTKIPIKGLVNIVVSMRRK